MSVDSDGEKGTPVNEHDVKLVRTAAEVMVWDAAEDGSDPQMELLGHNPNAINWLGDKVAQDLIAMAESDYDLTDITVIRGLISTGFLVGALAAEIAYGQKDEPAGG